MRKIPNKIKDKVINMTRRECEIKSSQYRYGMWWVSTGHECLIDGIWWNEFINSDGEINYFN